MGNKTSRMKKIERLQLPSSMYRCCIDLPIEFVENTV